MVVKDYLIRQNPLTIKEIISNFYFIKIKNHSLQKINIKSEKARHRVEKMYKMHRINRELIPKICKEFL